MTTTQDVSSDGVESEYPGYYYDGKIGKIVALEVVRGEVKEYLYKEDEANHTFGDVGEFVIEDTSLRRVPEFTVNNPVRVARKVYNNGYTRCSSVTVGNMRLGIPSIEYVDMVVELVEADSGSDIND